MSQGLLLKPISEIFIQAIEKVALQLSRTFVLGNPWSLRLYEPANLNHMHMLEASISSSKSHHGFSPLALHGIKVRKNGRQIRINVILNGCCGRPSPASINRAAI